MRTPLLVATLLALAACAPDPGEKDVEPDVQPCVAAAERCNGLDDDCDGEVDELAGDRTRWFADADADGWGAGAPTLACLAPEGAVLLEGDCDDAAPDVHPEAQESCNTRDDDCDGATDEDGAVGGAAAYADADGDGYGDPDVVVSACALPPGFVADASDCNDSADGVYPGAPEACDDVDEDCDGAVDEDVSDAPSWYADVDGDGYGDAGAPTAGCDQPAGHVSDASDCDDADPAASPDGDDVARDGVDQDCDGADRCAVVTPWVGEVTLTTETQMETFCASFDAVDGSLYVEDADVVDLSALSCLCEVTEQLKIAELDRLESLDGLEDLARIDGVLTIQDNPALESVAALGTLHTLGGLRVDENPALVELVGFEGVRAITYYVDIDDNNGLVDLTGLDNLATVGTDLTVSGNRALTSLRGLDGVTTVGESVTIEGTWLSDLSGLGGLVSVGRALDVSDNYVLASLDGLDALTSVGSLQLDHNGALVDITALEDLTSLASGLRVDSNAALRDPTGLHNITTVGGDVVLRSARGPSPLTSVGLGALTSVGGYLMLDELDDVTDLRGLASLTTVAGALLVQRMGALTSVAGLEQLRSVGGRFSIDANPALTDVSAAHGVELVGDDLEVTDNTSLPTRSATDLRDAIDTITGYAVISGNAL